MFTISTPADLLRAIDAYTQAGAPHRAVFLRALWQGRIAHWEPQRVGSCGKAKLFLRQVRKPALVVIGDDDGISSGPAGWSVAPRLLRWARQVVVHGSGAVVAEYDAMVTAAEMTGRLLLIETSSRCLPAWVEAANRWAPTAVKLAVRVRSGEHPVVGAEMVH